MSKHRIILHVIHTNTPVKLALAKTLKNFKASLRQTLSFLCHFLLNFFLLEVILSITMMSSQIGYAMLTTFASTRTFESYKPKKPLKHLSSISLSFSTRNCQSLGRKRKLLTTVLTMFSTKVNK